MTDNEQEHGVEDVATETEETVTTNDAVDESPTEARAMMTPVETRKVNGRDVEFRMMTAPLKLEERAVDASGPVRFVGYAAVFDSPSERLWDSRRGDFVETIAPTAFTRTLSADREVRMYVNHNSDMVLSSTRSATLSLSVDKRGLRVESELPDTSYARDLEALMRTGVVDSMSFGFSIPTGGDTWSADGSSRELREIILHEVSVVTGFPAYPDTAGASVRSVDPDDAGEEDEPVVGVPVMLARRLSDLYARKA
jgi:HK97 family phage prohead protease